VASALLQAVACCSTFEGRSLAEGAQTTLTPEGTGKYVDPPRVWIEVRHTAGRWMPAGAAFTVGTDDGCDIQVAGDSTVSALQCLVVPLPGGTVVIDAWSSVFATRRLAPECHCLQEPGSPGQQQLTAFVLPPGHCTHLMVGERTTITLRRPAPECDPAAINGKFALTEEARAGRGSTLVLAKQARQQLCADGRDDVAPPREGLTLLLEEQLLRDAARQASSSHQASTSSAGGGHSSQARLQRCIAAIRAGVRMRLLSVKSTLRSRQQRDLLAEVRWRCRAALRSGVLLERQCQELEARLLPGSSRSAAYEVLKVLDLLGAPLRPKLPLEARGRKRPMSDLALPAEVLPTAVANVPLEQHHRSAAGTSAEALLAAGHCSRPWSRCHISMFAALAHARRSAARGRILVRKVAKSAFKRFRPKGYLCSNHGLKASAARGHCSTQQLWWHDELMPNANG